MPPVADADPLQAEAAQAFADDLAANHVPSVRTIRARLHVGQPRAQRVQAYLATITSSWRGQPGTVLEGDGFTALSSWSRWTPLTSVYAVRGGVGGRRRPLWVRAARVPGDAARGRREWERPC
jgi:hypothetical protein